LLSQDLASASRDCRSKLWKERKGAQGLTVRPLASVRDRFPIRAMVFAD
jgi:hypothetical protein